MVIRTLGDGSYEWGCEDCGRRHLEQAHRGPRKSVCKACQNKRYRKSGGEGLRERMRLQRHGTGRGILRAELTGGTAGMRSETGSPMAGRFDNEYE